LQFCFQFKLRRYTTRVQMMDEAELDDPRAAPAALAGVGTTRLNDVTVASSSTTCASLWCVDAIPWRGEGER